MSQKSTVIEINGKRYDALSGKLLGDANGSVITAPKPMTGSGSLDGFTRNPTPVKHATVHAATKVAQFTAPTKQLRQVSDIVRAPGKHVQHHKPTNSQTLVRHAVKKPAPSLKRHTKVQHRTDVLVKQPSITVKPKLSSYQLDQTRVQRAKQTPRHPEATRYALDRKALQPRPAPSSVKPVNPIVAKAAPVHADTATIAVPARAKPINSRPVDVFEQALARANSHIEKPVTRRHTRHRKALFGSRALSIGATSLAVLLLVGFFAFQQRTNLTMRYAASKAGVAASLPAFKPAGFSAGKLTYSPGVVSVNFTNPRSGDSFALTQKSSSWDSQALLDSFVSSRTRTYQTIDAAGRTIYTYGNNNATWVDNGVWYRLDTKGSLTTNQLVELALSM